MHYFLFLLQSQPLEHLYENVMEVVLLWAMLTLNLQAKRLPDVDVGGKLSRVNVSTFLCSLAVAKCLTWYKRKFEGSWHFGATADQIVISSTVQREARSVIVVIVDIDQGEFIEFGTICDLEMRVCIESGCIEMWPIDAHCYGDGWVRVYSTDGNGHDHLPGCSRAYVDHLVSDTDGGRQLRGMVKDVSGHQVESFASLHVRKNNESGYQLLLDRGRIVETKPKGSCQMMCA